MTKAIITKIQTMDLKEVILTYNNICIKHKKNNTTLKDLTDRELVIWIAGQTLNYGRSLKNSIDNALCHIEDRAKVEKLFGYRHNN